jgi:flap endonuclease-1
MGLNIKDIIKKKEVSVEELKGKTLCVDAFNILYQFLTTIRQYDGTPLMDSEDRVTSHLSGIFYRNASLIGSGLNLIYVFDGKAPELKRKVHTKRKEVRDIAEKKYEEAKERGEEDLMKRYSSQLLRLDNEMISESKELLEAMGVCVLQAPSEGEAEASFLSKSGKAFGIVSQDYDSLIFGTPVLIRNLTVSKKKKQGISYVEVLPEKIILEEVLSELEINQDQFICLAILVGTDYNPKGVPGLGQKKALAVVKEFKTPEKIFESVNEKINELDGEDYFDWKEIFDLLKNPYVEDFEIEFPKLNEGKIKEILIERHGFSEERVQKQIDKIKGALKEKSQKNLGKWF